MAREIKFRAFDKMLNRYLFDGDGFSPIGEFTILRQVEMYCDENMAGLQTTFERMGYIELEQFTGLRLNDGTEVFEGDIYEYRYEYDSDYDGDMPIVKESSGRKVVKDIFDTWQIKEALSEGGTVKVIGNIHQHPELIQK